jgi:hypothetical protein
VGFLAAPLGKFAAAMGGAPAAGGIIVTGLVVGLIAGASAGGAFNAGGSAQPSIGQAEAYACPNMGPPVLTLTSGQHVLIIGKTADGTWFEAFAPGPGRKSVWVPAAAYALLGGAAPDDIPDTECDPATITAAAAAPAESQSDVGSFEPTAVPTALPTPSPTPRPTATPGATARATAKPTAKPKPPTPPPPPPPPADTTPPVWSSLSAQWKSGLDCKTILVSAVVTDPESGVTGVTLLWFDGNQGQGSKKMTKQSGRLWTAEVGTAAAPPVPGNWLFYATAKSAGGQSESPEAPFTVHC